MGRPLKFDEDIGRIIIAGVRSGLPKSHYCALAGIHPATFNAWIELADSAREAGRRGKLDRALLAFDLAVRKARAEWVAERLQAIKESEIESWQAAAWQLERLLPAEFGRRVDVGVSDRSVLPFTADELAQAEHELSGFGRGG